jgi:cysteine synthase A
VFLFAFCLAGREILQQTHGRLHAFVSGAGTGGTIAGVSQALKAHDPHIQVVLADPQGSSLFNKVSLIMWL